MTDWTGGPEPEWGRELEEEFAEPELTEAERDPNPGYHGEGELADYDPATGRSSWDDWGS